MATDRDNRGRATSINQIKLIERRVREEFTVKEICAFLDQLYGGDALQLRAVQTRAKEVRDNQLPWDRLTSSGAQAAKVLEVLRVVIEASEGRKREFTQAEVDWIIWIQELAPTLPEIYVWQFANTYLTDSKIVGHDFRQLDAFLAYKPWESEEAAIQYDDLKNDGLIPDSELTEKAAEVRQYIYKKEAEQDPVLSEEEIRAGMKVLKQQRLEVDAMRMQISESGVDFEEDDWENIDFDEPDIRDLLNEQMALQREILEEIKQLKETISGGTSATAAISEEGEREQLEDTSFKVVGEYYYNEDNKFVPVPLSEELTEEIRRLRGEDEQT